MALTITQAVRLVEETLSAHLVEEPPMVVIKDEVRTSWSGYRVMRRNEVTLMISTEQLARVAKAKNPQRVIANWVRKAGGATKI